MLAELEKVLSKLQPIDLDNYTVVVFGAGNTSTQYQKYFRSENIDVVYYVDNNQEKQNTIFYEKPVISLQQLLEFSTKFKKPPLVLICSLANNVCVQIKNQMKQSGLQNCTMDEYVFSKNKEKIFQVYDMLVDDFSKEVYSTVIISRILTSAMPANIVDTEQHFILPEFCVPNSNEVFIDLGAYVGDSVEHYINNRMGMFGYIFAFEPDKRNFNAMCSRICRLKTEWALTDRQIVPVNAGVGLKTEKLFFSVPAPPTTTHTPNHI
ncbi:hypothetical protein FACS1894102_0520 [Spirochaetia bacterium]|nr:hypothetical protein FACS1894102_0520 [Spirochaetia bacterium]